MVATSSSFLSEASACLLLLGVAVNLGLDPVFLSRIGSGLYLFIREPGPEVNL